MSERFTQLRSVYSRMLSRVEPIDPATDVVLRRLLRFAPDDRSARVLDAGCGAAQYAAAMVKAGYRNLTAVDLFAHPSISNHRNFEFVQADICALPFKNETFDLVYANSVLYYAPEPAAAIREFHRVLKPNGTLFFTGHTRHSLFTAYRATKRLLGMQSVSHLVNARFLPTRYYRASLQQAGFEVLAQDGYRLFPSPLDSWVRRFSKGLLPLGGPEPLRVLRSHVGYHFMFAARRGSH